MEVLVRNLDELEDLILVFFERLTWRTVKQEEPNLGGERPDSYQTGVELIGAAEMDAEPSR